jgi:hypothetical protein
VVTYTDNHWFKYNEALQKLQLVGVKWANPVMTICVALPSQDGQYTNHYKADAQNPLQQMRDSQNQYANDNRNDPHPQSGYFRHDNPAPPLLNFRLQPSLQF